MDKYNDFVEDALDRHKAYSIVGVSKSGTTSATKFLTTRGYTVDKCDGWFDKPTFQESYGKTVKTENHTPIIIMRDPVERAWSHYHYMFQNKPVEDTDEHIKKERLEQVSRLSCYTEHVMNWLDVDPDTVIFWYEDLIELDDFPHENKTIVKPELDELNRKYIENYIMDEFHDFFNRMQSENS